MVLLQFCPRMLHVCRKRARRSSVHAVFLMRCFGVPHHQVRPPPVLRNADESPLYRMSAWACYFVFSRHLCVKHPSTSAQTCSDDSFHCTAFGTTAFGPTLSVLGPPASYPWTVFSGTYSCTTRPSARVRALLCVCITIQIAHTLPLKDTPCRARTIHFNAKRCVATIGPFMYTLLQPVAAVTPYKQPLVQLGKQRMQQKVLHAQQNGQTELPKHLPIAGWVRAKVRGTRTELSQSTSSRSRQHQVLTTQHQDSNCQ